MTAAPASPPADASDPGADLQCWSRDRLGSHRAAFGEARPPGVQRASNGLPGALHPVSPEQRVREHREAKRGADAGVGEHIEQGKQEDQHPCFAIWGAITAKAPN